MKHEREGLGFNRDLETVRAHHFNWSLQTFMFVKDLDLNELQQKHCKNKWNLGQWGKLNENKEIKAKRSVCLL